MVDCETDNYHLISISSTISSHICWLGWEDMRRAMRAMVRDEMVDDETDIIDDMVECETDIDHDMVDDERQIIHHLICLYNRS